MKSLLISIRPEWVAKILNGDKTIEIRKTMPKCDLPIDVYIYCTKGKPNVTDIRDIDGKPYYCVIGEEYNPNLNGKVVAKFTLREVERFVQGLNEAEYEHLPNFALKDYDYYGLEDLMEKACLNDEEINKYAPDLSFYAWHISDLVIFDEPKNITEFSEPYECGELPIPLTRAPESWRYVEVTK